MYCETENELAIFNNLRISYPNKSEYLMDLMAWVFYNRPERFCEIIEAHKVAATNDLMDLADFDISSILKHNE